MDAAYSCSCFAGKVVVYPCKQSSLLYYRCAPGSFSHLATTNYTQRAWLACVDSLVPGARGWLLAGMQASYTPAMSDGCLYYTTCVASLARSTSGVPLIPQVQQFKK